MLFLQWLPGLQGLTLQNHLQTLVRGDLWVCEDIFSRLPYFALFIILSPRNLTNSFYIYKYFILLLKCHLELYTMHFTCRSCEWWLRLAEWYVTIHLHYMAPFTICHIWDNMLALPHVNTEYFYWEAVEHLVFSMLESCCCGFLCSALRPPLC